jgi:hypothetical protein|tara:strand:- start:24963 stop:25226 length:264 start_codon:yes stop_codon:yes gene_type:complete
MSIKRKGVTKGEIVSNLKELIETQGKIVQWLKAINEKLNLVDNVLGAYVNYKGDEDDFKIFIEKKNKEIEEEAASKQDSDKVPKKKK